MSEGQNRRTFVEWLLGIGVMGSLVSFLYPVLRFVIPPPVAEAIELNVVAATLGEIPPNSGKIFKFGRRPALLINTPAGELRAFDGICTHLNCTVQYRQDFGQVWCACHNGFYDLTGKNIAGPPPRPLPRLEVQVRGEEIVVSRRSS
ncbi:MAG TPA: Rieske (2Fe-2S) protein [Vicinamibacteria bacterium]|nr:Rieske (2Fe-2S) protein [Vicinamibacteria bacterium]